MDLFDLDAIERVESELDSFIEKRSRSQEEVARTEELYAESVRRFHRHRHRENAQGWYDHHECQIVAHQETFGRLLAYHSAERARYAAMLGFVTGDTEEVA